jgi:hypothetical protein
MVHQVLWDLHLLLVHQVLKDQPDRKVQSESPAFRDLRDLRDL